MLSRVAGWWSGPSGVPGVTRLNGLLALVLSVIVVDISSGMGDATDPKGGVWVCAAALLMTLPVAWRRDAPLQAIGVLAAGAVFNWLVVGSYVRCGAALPSLFLCLFSVADRLPLRPALLGAAFGLISGIAQANSDPRLKGFASGAAVVTVLFWSLGRLVRSRQAMVAALRARNDELLAQRDATARLAVAADRAQLAHDLDGALSERIGRLADDATSARAAKEYGANGGVSARDSLAAIEDEGRRALGDLREIVGTLRDDVPVGPQPSLRDLDGLLTRFGPGGATLAVEGEPVRLPAVIELSAFRIVERLLEPLEEPRDGGPVRITLRYAPERLDLRVEGRPRNASEAETALAAARQWGSLQAAQFVFENRAGCGMTEVRLPLVTAHA